jgi:hypothetical protein
MTYGAVLKGSCKYGISGVASDNDEYGYECKIPATRHIARVDKHITSDVVSTSCLGGIDLCETHYQKFLRWYEKE